MEFDALSISILLGIAIFLFIIFISAIFYNLEHKGTRMPANTRTIGYSMILTQKCIVQFTDMKSQIL